MNSKWKRSSRCSGGSCVEVRMDGDLVQVRDSKLGEGGPVLGFTIAEWDDFLAGAAAGNFSTVALAESQ